MKEEEISKMVEYADLVETVYEEYSGQQKTFPDDWEEVEYDNLRGIALNQNKKEIALLFRGLLLDKDPRDSIILANLLHRNMRDSSPGIRGGQFGYNDSHESDLIKGQQKLDQIKKGYPDYKIILAGHSRGAHAALHLGRNNPGLEVHAFSPAQGQYEEIPDIYDPLDVNIYYTDEDIIPINTRRQSKVSNNKKAIDTFKKNYKSKIVKTVDAFENLFQPKTDSSLGIAGTIIKPLFADISGAILKASLKDPELKEDNLTNEKHFVVPSNKRIRDEELNTFHSITGHDIRHFSQAKNPLKVSQKKEKTAIKQPTTTQTLIYNTKTMKYEFNTPQTSNDFQQLSKGMSFDDYIVYLKRIGKYQNRNQARRIFDMLDSDNNGFLNELI